MNTALPDSAHPYPVMCSWCLKKPGKQHTVCGFCEIPDSHGICRQCHDEILDKVNRRRQHDEI